ncbi:MULTISPECIES: hypothetical protein [Streptomyces]|uniref:hypothetical protein n=1 Tax=Streptomyces TaxID=1883 RepID=UPI00053EF40D|nr:MULTISPECIES: hypothetical protein [unclassified Streptomyces]MYX48662.1 hypothetical protein [Streptomyces sp. SID8385]WTC39957.1 hypothetical protein OH723_31835 [Streptomyces albidoflavus]MBT2876434.1 hypothetical protein [Streptomyces sp. McG6]MBT2883044.1 hypothetical protein [Streptomyces sp. McG5]MBT2889247.1 hypothetical protein [Streptomyces sp. McG2]
MRTIAQRCADNGGITNITLGELRAELGKQKLGRYVLGSIQELLTDDSLGWFPTETLNPDLNTAPRQEQIVWVYSSAAGPVADAIDVILKPGGRDVAAVLRSLLGQGHGALSTDEKIKAIQEIVNA